MSIPSRLSSYLDERGLRYEVCAHDYSHTSAHAAHAAGIRPHLMAKSVILEDDAGCVMAVVPADRRVMLGEVAHMLGRRDLHLSDEQRIATLFADCDLGAVPPVGMAWGMEMIVDDELEASEVIYFEAGDHQSLVRMSREHFHELMKTVPHGHIAKATVH